MGACALLTACASAPSSRPGERKSAPAGMQHQPLALGEISSGGVLHNHPAPIYPAALQATQLPPQEVQAQLLVDAAGKVSEVHMAGEAQADSNQRQFMAAVRAAAMQWTFEPLRVTQWAADASGNTHDVGSEAQPFSVVYVFRFAWKDGKPSIDISKPPGGSL